jgi:hypothetical protein
VLSPVTQQPLKDRTLMAVEPIRQMVNALVDVKLQQLRNAA